MIDQEDPHLKSTPPFFKLMRFFIFVKFCMYVTIFFHMIQKKLRDPVGNQVMLYHLQNTKESTAT